MCGGKGAVPWVMTNVYQYVKEKYGIEPDAPEIRKPGEPLLEGENTEPTLDMLTTEPQIYTRRPAKPTVMIMDYMNGLYNPFLRSNTFHVFEFSQKDVMDLARGNDNSVNSFFMVVMAKAVDKVLAANNQTWGQRTLMDSDIRLVKGAMTIPQQCRIAHCSIVALMFDTKDKHILQAYETNLDD